MSENLTENSGKGRPTPTRKEQEAARKRPLVPDDRKEAKRIAKEKAAKERQKVREGIASGDERYLPPRDQGKQKKFVRDFVDARFNVGEFMMPVAIVFMILATIFVKNIDVSQAILLVLWMFMIATVIDSIFLARKVKQALIAKFGEAEKGTGLYAAGRALQMRRLRLPKAQVERKK